MKKCFTLLLALLMMAGVFRVEPLPVNAATVNTNRSFVATIQGKKVYFNSKKKALERKTKKGKYQKISKYKAREVFCVSGNYIYYATKHNRICRTNATGKSQKRYSVSARSIKTVKDGYIYYYRAIGLYRISTKGKDNIRLLTNFTDLWDSKIVKDRIYYTKADIGEFDKTKNPPQTLTVSLYSKKLDGTDLKLHKVFDGNCDSMMDANERYVFAAGVVGNKIEYIVLDTDTEELEVKVIRTEEDGQVLNGHVELQRYTNGVIDGLWYYQYNGSVYTMDVNGNQRKIIDISNYVTENILSVIKDGKYLKIYDRYALYIYNKDGTMVKKITNKHGKIKKSNIKGDKITVVFRKNKKMLKKTFKLK